MGRDPWVWGGSAAARVGGCPDLRAFLVQWGSCWEEGTPWEGGSEGNRDLLGEAGTPAGVWPHETGKAGCPAC